MTDAAYKVWEAFKSGLTVKPTDYMKKALATSIREIANQCCEDEGVEDAQTLYELSYDVEAL